MKQSILLLLFFPSWLSAYCWGFFGHQQINYHAVFLLPPEMMVLFKPMIGFLKEHAVDPDKRRYIIKEEAPRHYIDIDRYKNILKDSLQLRWKAAVAKYSEDSLNAHGIVPWWIQSTLYRLTEAFRAKDKKRILKLAAELGHYIADSHVPLHASSNHNGQYTDQKGIHGFWESRVPELLALTDWDFFIGKASYIDDPSSYTWARVWESAAAADTVLKIEKELSLRFPTDQRFSFENRNGVLVRQYSAAYTKAYDQLLKGMIERRMRLSIFSIASFWYTAWVNAGQPSLSNLAESTFSVAELEEFQKLNKSWQEAQQKEENH